MARKQHTSKEIEREIQFAEKKGWRLRPPGKSAHCFGILMCPHNDKDCRCGVYCQVSVWGTPKNPSNDARKIRRVVENCIHQKGKRQDGS